MNSDTELTMLGRMGWNSITASLYINVVLYVTKQIEIFFSEYRPLK